MRALTSGLVCLAWGVSSAFVATSIQAADYLIKNATVHTATAKGTLNKADVLIRDGKIVQVASDINSQHKVIQIDATGKHLTPGLVNASTQVGLVEISAVSGTVDASTKLQGIGASFNIAPAINFRSTVIPQNRINGMTRAVVLPRSTQSIFAGQGAVIALHSSLRGLLIENAAVVAQYDSRKGGGSRAAAMQLLDTALSEAKYLRANEAEFKPGVKSAFSQSVADLKALYPVLDRKIPLIISANRVDDIQRLIKLSQKHNFRLVISGGGEAWLVAKQLAQANVAVIMDPMSNLPQFDALSVRLDAAAKLYQAGVKLLFTGGDTHNGYLVRQSAGNAVAYGLPASAALEAMTINTAEVFGIKHYGQIKAGMQADIVLWDAEPLEITSTPELVLIQGEKQPLTSRSTRLADRYWELKGNHQQAFENSQSN
ncbi:amidohydrolase family protein [Aliikangiella sp. IMCC44653]